MSKRLALIVGVLLAVTLIVAACADDEGGSADGASGDDAAEGGIASSRGVTEDTIRVGVAVPDFMALRQLGIPTYYGDYEVAYQAFFDRINEAGGIGGRMIEPYYATFDWSNPETQDAACTELTEDHEVFIVLDDRDAERSGRGVRIGHISSGECGA